MNARARKTLKIVLLTVTALLLMLFVFGAVLTLNWPLWVGFFLVLLVAGGATTAFFFLQFWQRRRVQRFSDEIIHHEVSQQNALSGSERAELKDLHAKWKEAIETLRSSHLKKKGNPLYVLPWYLVIGESGTGKTTSLANAMLSSPLFDRKVAAGVVATKNCDWWFFDQAIVIDTAGRYSVPINQERDKEEWRNFLRLLAKYRKREPVNGVIVTVAADRLQHGDSEALADDGRTMRRRVDELMTVLGVRFPVYVLVTKCDLVPGMVDFAHQLPDQAMSQAMGVINQDLSTEVVQFVGQACSTLCDRLRNLRLHLLLQPQVKDARPDLLRFPEEVAGLRSNLTSFINAAFGPNEYQETPILRGVFFSSGQQERDPDAAAPSPRPTDDRHPVPRKSRGLFLHDLFTRILPQDRWVFAPTRSIVHWHHVTGNLGLISCLILGIAISGLLSFSFVKNLSVIRQIPQESSHPLTGEDLRTSLSSLYSYRQQVVALQERNKHWWMPRFGLNASLRLEQELKKRYCRDFHSAFLDPFDSGFRNDLSAFPSSMSEDIYGQYIMHLVRRINLLRARQGGGDSETLQRMPQPEFSVASVYRSEAPAELNAKTTANYVCYLLWNNDSGEISREMSGCQTSLKQLLALKEGNSQWLVAWVDRHSGITSVTLRDFWGGSLSAADEPQIRPAFTRKGQDEIASMLREIEAALPGEWKSGRQRAELERWYSSARYAAWEAFAAAFPRGAERLKGEREWQEVAAKMTTDEGPYLALLIRMCVELERDLPGGNLPSWLRQLHQFQLMKNAPAKQAQTVNKGREAGKRLITAFGKDSGKEADGSGAGSVIAGSQTYQDYRAALTAMAPATLSRMQAYQAAVQAYTEDPAVSKSPFAAGYAASRKLARAVVTDNAPNEIMGRLFIGPVDFLWAFVREQASGSLQSQWEEQVLSGTLGMTGQQATAALLGQEGLVWKFVKGPAAPFLTRSLQGYRPKEMYGGRVHFVGGFFSFLEHGSQVQAATMGKQSNYSVGIQGLPTDTNSEAVVKPQATRLELQCAGTSQMLTNLNYPIAKTFNWSPDACTDVLFQIEVGDLVLTKRYMGPQAFPDFLQSFGGGKRTFYPKDFPGEKASLENLGIKFIRVNYHFIGSGPITKQAALSCGPVPRSIARCWTF